MQKSPEYKNFKNIVNIFYNEELEGIGELPEDIKHPGTIKIEPKVFYDKFLFYRTFSVCYGIFTFRNYKKTTWWICIFR